MSNEEVIQGVFKEELKNRFLCLVEINGSDTLCYVPSSCRLSNFVDLTGKNVLLLKNKDTNTRTRYSVYALLVKNSYVLLNMSRVNRIVLENIYSRRFSLLGARKTIQKELVIDGYKSDLYINDTNTIVEIKSILSFERIARFPSVHSQRALEQLKKINVLLEKGYNVCYIFVSLNPNVKVIRISNDINEYEFHKIFESCIIKGMKIKGISLRFVDNRWSINSNLKIEL